MSDLPSRRYITIAQTIADLFGGAVEVIDTDVFVTLPEVLTNDPDFKTFKFTKAFVVLDVHPSLPLHIRDNKTPQQIAGLRKHYAARANCLLGKTCIQPRHIRII